MVFGAPPSMSVWFQTHVILSNPGALIIIIIISIIILVQHLTFFLKKIKNKRLFKFYSIPLLETPNVSSDYPRAESLRPPVYSTAYRGLALSLVLC